MKKPRAVELTGAGGGHKAHAIWLRKGEMNCLPVRWKQVIASSFTGVGYPAGVQRIGQLQINPITSCEQAQFFNHVIGSD